MSLNVDPQKLFGVDLVAVFGPQANRKPIDSFTDKEITTRLSKVPKYVPTDDLGPTPSLFEITNKILGILARAGALKGIDLPWTTSLLKIGLARHKSAFFHVSKIVKNNRVQRGVQLHHLLKDLLFKFNPTWVQSGLARYSENERRYYLNDAQHRMIACIILGIREIPLEYVVSELHTVDVQQYSCVNLHSLESSEFDKYRIKVETVNISKSEKVAIKDKDFLNAWEVFQILQANGCELIEKGGDGRPGNLKCTNAGNILKYYSDYGKEIFSRAIAINASAFSKAPLAAQNIWGICEFIKRQQAEGVLKSNKFQLDMYIIDAFAHFSPNHNRNGFYTEAIQALNRTKASDLAIPYQDRVAAGIERFIRVVHPEVNWAPIKFAGDVIADVYLTNDVFPVVPLSKTKKVTTVSKDRSMLEMA